MSLAILGGPIFLAMLYLTSLPNNQNPLRDVESSTVIQSQIKKKELDL